MTCPNCGMMAFVVSDELGRRCDFCGATWPYEEKVELA